MTENIASMTDVYEKQERARQARIVAKANSNPLLAELVRNVPGVAEATALLDAIPTETQLGAQKRAELLAINAERTAFYGSIKKSGKLPAESKLIQTINGFEQRATSAFNRVDVLSALRSDIAAELYLIIEISMDSILEELHSRLIKLAEAVTKNAAILKGRLNGESLVGAEPDAVHAYTDIRDALTEYREIRAAQFIVVKEMLRPDFPVIEANDPTALRGYLLSARGSAQPVKYTQTVADLVTVCGEMPWVPDRDQMAEAWDMERGVIADDYRSRERVWNGHDGDGWISPSDLQIEV